MIVSGRHVLFLDPTAQPGRIHGNKTLSGRLITLTNMKQYVLSFDFPSFSKTFTDISLATWLLSKEFSAFRGTLKVILEPYSNSP